MQKKNLLRNDYPKNVNVNVLMNAIPEAVSLK